MIALVTTVVAGAFAQSAPTADRALWGSIAAAPSSGSINLGDYQQHNGKLLLTWRMLPGDDASTAFDLYRRIGDGPESQLNMEAAFVGDDIDYVAVPIVGTNFTDTPSASGKDMHYRLTLSGDTTTIGRYTISAEQVKQRVPYIEIPLASTDDVTDYPDLFKYQANDCSVGDLDGDGRMEIVVKRLLTYYDASGNVTGTSEGAGDSDSRARHIALFEAYRLDGMLLWRVKSGPNIIAGNSINFAVADLDGDGCAEVVTKTSEGTVFGDGYEIPDTDADGITDYRSIWPAGHYTGDGPKGYGGPEFFSVIDGKTGRELARANFIARGPEGQTPAEWAANWYENDWRWDPRDKKYQWKLANSLRLGVAQFTGRGMQIFLGRGVYGRTIVEGWQYTPPTADGTSAALTRLWHTDTDDAGGEDRNKDGKPYSAYAGQGNHAFNVTDLDGDGLDEVMYGSCAWDNDGAGLWTTGLGHGDANHVGKFLPDREGLQVYHCLENGKTQVALHDARTGATLWQKVGTEDNDMGRCMVADVDPSSPGCEFWMYGSELLSQDGSELYAADGKRKKESSANAGIWFDGSLSRQMINENIIHSFAHGRTFTMYRFDESFINGTKSNPSWYGDMLGDWREEVIVPDQTKVRNLKVFSTWYPTSHRFPWLMTDHTYYMQCIHQQVGYNQPNNLGYYLGTDLQSDEQAWEAARPLEHQTEPTAVSDIRNDVRRQADDHWYTLSGQRVAAPQRGLYIRNGRKVVVR